MKICAIICEYNPFHNGHAYQIQEAKRQSGADYIVCIMSGNFVERGEEAILEKHVRAKHAILSGADAVVELPVSFSTSPAELFSRGGVKIAHALGADVLSFGVESGTRESLLETANLLLHEPTTVSERIKELLKDGVSYAKARQLAYLPYVNEEYVSSPNNILALEYTKAILSKNYPLQILPIKRKGAGYLDSDIQTAFASAKSIRENLANREKLKEANCMPTYVLKDLPSSISNNLAFLERLSVLSTPSEEIRKVCDCTEGLENALKKQAKLGDLDLVSALTSKRYTASRIRRILLQNLLSIHKQFILSCLDSPLYLRLLAIRKDAKELLSYLGNRNDPLIVKNADADNLTAIAKDCLEKEEFADDVYAILQSSKKPKNNPFV